jgi:ectoine hydroxylase-related dioxygenase (phytanoyl-CoA dioxygenase family)
MTLTEVRSPETSAAPLPTPTSDREQAKADLALWGYCIIQDALSPSQVRSLRARMTEQAAGEDAGGAGFHDSGNNQRIWMLVNKGRVFRDLVEHPLAVEMMTELLGPDFLLSSLTANIARPGGKPMYLHTDQGYVEFWTPKPVVANIAWMLDDFTDENGGTRLLPGSHLMADWRAERSRPTIAAEGPAGAALVFDGRLIHGTGANRTADQHRHAVLSYYCRPFMRQQENFAFGLHTSLRTQEQEPLLRRLGFNIQRGLGRVEAPREGERADKDTIIRALDERGSPADADEPLPGA